MGQEARKEILANWTWEIKNPITVKETGGIKDENTKNMARYLVRNPGL